jgi:hypothetical protein
LSRRIRVGGRVVTVFVFEVVEPFFSVAAAPQHIPSWMRLPITAGVPPAGVALGSSRGAGTEYSAATVSRTRGRLNQLDARLGAESKWHLRLASCREGLFFPVGTRADATVSPPSHSLSFSKALLRAPSAFAVASALTRWRSLRGPRRRRRRMGRTPFAEPERRSSRPTSPPVAVCVAGGRRSRTVPRISPCARRSSPADASPPPAQSSIRDAS